MLATRAHYATESGDPERGRSLASDGLASAWEVGDLPSAMTALLRLGQAQQGADPELARTLFAAVQEHPATLEWASNAAAAARGDSSEGGAGPDVEALVSAVLGSEPPSRT